MAKNNPVTYLPLLFIKIIWKNVDTFLGIREKTAAELLSELLKVLKTQFCIVDKEFKESEHKQ